MTHLPNYSELDLEGLYRLTEKWISDLAFYRDELTFLHKLINRFYPDMLYLENLGELRESVIDLQDAGFQCDRLLSRIKVHQNNLVNIIALPIEPSVKRVLFKHQELIDQLVAFKKNIKGLKKVVFCATELVMEAKKKEIF